MKWIKKILKIVQTMRIKNNYYWSQLNLIEFIKKSLKNKKRQLWEIKI